MTPKCITIHCSDSPDGRAVSTQEIRLWHTDAPPKGRGWKDIGYHAVVELDGGLGKGRAENTVGAHVENHNDGNLGLCFVGTHRFTRAQFATARLALTLWMKVYGIALENVMGHYQWDTAVAQGKTCPNMAIEDLRAWLAGDDSSIEKYVLEVS